MGVSRRGVGVGAGWGSGTPHFVNVENNILIYSNTISHLTSLMPPPPNHISIEIGAYAFGTQIVLSYVQALDSCLSLKEYV